VVILFRALRLAHGNSPATGTRTGGPSRDGVRSPQADAADGAVKDRCIAFAVDGRGAGAGETSTLMRSTLAQAAATTGG
jgi:hypothetical protein